MALVSSAMEVVVAMALGASLAAVAQAVVARAQDGVGLAAAAAVALGTSQVAQDAAVTEAAVGLAVLRVAVEMGWGAMVVVVEVGSALVAQVRAAVAAEGEGERSGGEVTALGA